MNDRLIMAALGKPVCVCPPLSFRPVVGVGLGMKDLDFELILSLLCLCVCICVCVSRGEGKHIRHALSKNE